MRAIAIAAVVMMGCSTPPRGGGTSDTGGSSADAQGETAGGGERIIAADGTDVTDAIGKECFYHVDCPGNLTCVDFLPFDGKYECAMCAVCNDGPELTRTPCVCDGDCSPSFCTAASPIKCDGANAIFAPHSPEREVKHRNECVFTAPPED